MKPEDLTDGLSVEISLDGSPAFGFVLRTDSGWAVVVAPHSEPDADWGDGDRFPLTDADIEEMKEITVVTRARSNMTFKTEGTRVIRVCSE